MFRVRLALPRCLVHNHKKLWLILSLFTLGTCVMKGRFENLPLLSNGVCLGVRTLEARARAAIYSN